MTGGASQNLANILLGFTDPAYTRAVWAVSPCYFLAVPIFEDAGFSVGNGKLRGVREDAEGVDLEELERGILEVEKGREWPEKAVSLARMSGGDGEDEGGGNGWEGR